MLNPTSIALVGASDESAWAPGMLRSLNSWGAWPGRVHMVNPNREAALGQRCYNSVSEIPDQVDHAAIVVAAKRVPNVLRDCAAAGVHAATIIAAGFQEAGPVGQALSDEVAAVCAENDIAVVGPNCYGFNNYAGTFVGRFTIDIQPMRGPIALACQSGQLANASADAAYGRGIGLRYLVSSGNELVVDTNDYWEFFLNSPEIKVFGGVIERIPDPRRFADIARRALEVGKPIVVLKPGKSAAASRIAIAHTGSVTGADAVVDAFLKDLGIIRVSGVEEMVETAGLLAARGWPKGNRTSFLGYSGGAGELFADQGSEAGLVFPELTKELTGKLSEISTVRPQAIHNPMDMTPSGGPHMPDLALAMAESGELDIVIAQGQSARGSDTPATRGPSHAANGGFTENIAKAESYGVILDTGDRQPGFELAHIVAQAAPHYLFGQLGVVALGHAARYGEFRRAFLSEPSSNIEVKTSPIRNSAVGLLSSTSGALTEAQSKELLGLYQIRVTEDVTVASPEEAEKAAGSLGFPVVLKVLASNVPHKSDAGGVILDVHTEEEVRAAYEAIISAVRGHVPDADIEGVLVCQQLPASQEFFAGITTDPILGPAVVAGLGGIYIEVFKDSVTLIPPFDVKKAANALTELRSYPLLTGTRGVPARDVDAFAELLVKIGTLALDLSGIVTELDLNPVFVMEEGEGVCAVDALAVVEPQPLDHQLVTPAEC